MTLSKFRNVCRAVAIPPLLSFVCINVKAQPLEPSFRPAKRQAPTSQQRARLRRAILDLAAKSGPEYSSFRPELALPLAQLGDWNGALRLLEKDMNAPQNSDELWHWRAYQLARAGKWNEVSGATRHIRSTPTRADALLFAARTAIDRGVMLREENDASQSLSILLREATSLLARPDAYSQLSYAAYLWSRGDDVDTSRRIFTRALQNARLSQENEKPKVFPGKEKPHELRYHDRAVRGVLMMQAQTGLLQDAMRNSKEFNEFDISWLPSLARTASDLRTVTSFINTLPAERRATQLFGLSITYSARGDKTQGRRWFDEARRLMAEVKKEPDSDPKKAQRAELLGAMTEFYAAHFLRDPGIEAAALNEMKALAAKFPEPGMQPEELDVLPEFLDLEARHRMGLPIPLPTLQRVDEIARKLQNAKPADMQFRALETVASYYVFYKREDKILPIAQSMLKVARELAAAEMKERSKRDTFFNPYWSRTPRMLTSIFWLQRAGDQESATTFAREFARTTPTRERPYAAMALTQLGFFKLADTLFDPAVEYPRIRAKQKANWESKRNFDWSDFSSWNDFAANEARYRSPDAPFRWIGRIDNDDSRAQVLRSWVGALYPEPRLTAPYVQVMGGRSSSSM